MLKEQSQIQKSTFQSYKQKKKKKKAKLIPTNKNQDSDYLYRRTSGNFLFHDVGSCYQFTLI